MRNFTFKRQLLFVMFMLLGCLSIQAADDGLITKQITIKLDKAGTLPDKIGSTKKKQITNLKIIGEIMVRIGVLSVRWLVVIIIVKKPAENYLC